MSFYKRINNKLIEKYPTIWNTKIVWILLISLAIHLIYFALGLVRFIVPATLRTEYSFHNQTDGEQTNILTYIIMLLMIVVWLSQLFKNNAFKNFYPHSSKKLFSTYIHYVIIFFAIISAPLSYTIGYKTFLNVKYPDVVTQQYKSINDKAKVFGINSPEYYTPENRAYPSPFDTLLKVTNARTIDKYPTINYGRTKLQYFEPIITKYKYENRNMQLDKLIQDAFYSSQSSDSVTIYNLGKFVDMSSQTIAPFSLYNFSAVTYQTPYSSSYSMNEWDINEYNVKSKVNRNKYVYELLNRNDKEEIRNILNDYLNLIKHFKIDHNLSTDRWMEIVYHPPLFKIDSFIKTDNPKYYDHHYENKEEYAYQKEAVVTEAIIIDSVENYQYDFIKGRLITDNSYLNINIADYTLERLNSLKSWEQFPEWLCIYFSVALALAHLLFAYRVTNLRSILFGVIIFAVLSLVIAFISFGINRITNDALLTFYLLLLISITIISLTVIAKEGISKKTTGSLVVLTIGLMPYFWLLIRAIINQHEELYMQVKYGSERYNHPQPLEFLGNWNFLIIWGLTIISIYFYCRIIKKYKALPEG